MDVWRLDGVSKFYVRSEAEMRAGRERGNKARVRDHEGQQG